MFKHTIFGFGILTLFASAASPTALAQSDGMQLSPQQTYSIPQDTGGGGWVIAGNVIGTTSVLLVKPGIHARVAVQNTSATATVACSWGDAAVLNSSGSFQLAPGQTRDYGPQTSGVPPMALNCIASAAATPVFVEKH